MEDQSLLHQSPHSFRAKLAVFVFITTIFVPGVLFAQIKQSSEMVQGLVGSWKLVSVEATRPNGDVIRDWGQNPAGLLVYDSKGNVTVQFGRDPRPKAANEQLTDDEKRTAYDGYLAYFGTYKLDEKAGTVTHHILGSMRPNDVGSQQKRFYHLSESKLTLATPPLRSVAAGSSGEQRVYRLVWERIK